MGTGRPDIENGADFFLDAVFFGNKNQGFQVDVNVVLILSSGIIDQNVYRREIRQIFLIPYIADKMGVIGVDNGRFLPIDSDHGMILLQK